LQLKGGKLKGILFGIFLTVTLISFVLAQEDAPGCKDHPLFNRLSNFYIVNCSENYNGVNLHISEEKMISKEGRVSRLITSLTTNQVLNARAH